MARTKEIRVQVNRLKKELKDCEDELSLYTNFSGKNISLEDVLRLSVAYFENYKNGITPFPKLQKGQTHDQVIETIETSLTNVVDQIHALKKRIQGIQSSIQSAYQIQELTQVPYHLHAVLVHDGLAGTGHYWAFIRISQNSNNASGNSAGTNDQWVKFNDTYVTLVNEETVWRESFGGDNSPTAYCLIYLEQNLADLKLTNNETEIQNLIPSQLKDLIFKENQKFEESLKMSLYDEPPPEYGPHPRSNTPVDNSATTSITTSSAASTTAWSSIKLDHPIKRDPIVEEAERWHRKYHDEKQFNKFSDPRLLNMEMFLASMKDSRKLMNYLKRQEQDELERMFQNFLVTSSWFLDGLQCLLNGKLSESILRFHTALLEEVTFLPEHKRTDEILEFLAIALIKLSDRIQLTIQDFTNLQSKLNSVRLVSACLYSHYQPGIFNGKYDEMKNNLTQNWASFLVQVQSEPLKEEDSAFVGNLFESFFNPVCDTLPKMTETQGFSIQIDTNYKNLIQRANSEYQNLLESLRKTVTSMDTDDDLPPPPFNKD